MVLLDGKAFSQELRQEIKLNADRFFNEYNRKVGLAVVIMLGNYGLLMGGEDTGEPFVLAYSTENGIETFGCYALDGSNPLTISITQGEFAKMDEKFLPESVEGVIIRSSTEGSNKKFKLTIDDSGTISATEIA